MSQIGRDVLNLYEGSFPGHLYTEVSKFVKRSLKKYAAELVSSLFL